ncbi:hypothetical protein M1145_01220 [Patescibacteria group bacterium]|nr:hypothetical protein [Patescibacteria group bacterium]
MKRFFLLITIAFIYFGFFAASVLTAQSSPQSITSIENSINSLQSQIGTYNSQIQALGSQKQNYVSSLASENAIFVKEESNLNAISSLLQSLNVRLQLDKSKEIKDIRNRNLDYKILYEDTKVNPFYIFFASTDMHSFLATWGSVQSQIYNLKNEILSINTRINNINNGLVFESKQKTMVQNEIASINAKRNALYTQIYGVNNSINSVSSLISNVNSKIANLEAKKAQIISSEKHSISENSVAQSTVTQNVNTINSNIGSSISSISNKNSSNSSGVYNLSLSNGKTFTNEKGPLNIDPQNISNPTSVNGVKYLGSIEIRSDTNVPFINILPLRYYLEGLGEMPSSWTITALEAQAIAARSYTLYHMGQFGSDHYDLSSSPNVDQNYIGYSKNEDCTVNGYCNWMNAIANTASQVVENNGNILDAFYNAMNGNITLNSSQMATVLNDTNYLQNGSGSLSSRENTIQNCSYWCSLPDTIVSSSNISSLSTSYSGSTNITVTVNGISLNAQYFAYVYNYITPLGYFIRVPNYSASPSSYDAYFSLTGNSSSGFSVDSLYGGLWVGLSQYGAENMSLSGFSLDEVLSDYYVGSTIGTYPNTSSVNVRVGISGNSTSNYSVIPSGGFNIYSNGTLIYSSSQSESINISG